MHFTGTNLKTLNLNNNTHKNHAANVHETEQKIHSPNRARLKYFLFHFLSQQRDKKNTRIVTLWLSSSFYLLSSEAHAFL